MEISTCERHWVSKEQNKPQEKGKRQNNRPTNRPVLAGLAGHLGQVHGLGMQDGVADHARLDAFELLSRIIIAISSHRTFMPPKNRADEQRARTKISLENT